MEWSLQLESTFIQQSPEGSFNPYFHGVVAAIRCDKCTCLIGSTVFQSLFSWSGRCNVKEKYIVFLLSIVSILIFMEWSLQSSQSKTAK